ncbi:MAG: PolC-type DNA polymerase III [Finegoldia sp.]|nr:PolC-type DNA polymerase III [Finegoldia sp.]
MDIDLLKVLKENNIDFKTDASVLIEDLTYKKKSDRLSITISLSGKVNKTELEDILRNKLLSFISDLQISFKCEEKSEISKDLIESILIKDSYKGCISKANIGDIRIEEDLITINFPIKIMEDNFNNRACDKKLSDDIEEATGKKYLIKTSSNELDLNDDYKESLKNSENKARNAIIADSKKTKSEKKESSEKGSSQKTGKIQIGKDINEEPVDIKTVTTESGEVCISGEVIDLDVKPIKNGNTFILSMDIIDKSYAILAKKFFSKKEYEECGSKIQVGTNLLLKGQLVYDQFTSGFCFNVRSLQEIGQQEGRSDQSLEKRIELHAFSQMSQLDGFIDLKKMCKTLKEWGHEAVGLTDKCVVQGYPEFFDACSSNGIKPLFGMEAKILEDNIRIITNPHKDMNMEDLVVFDLETTGLNNSYDKITEIGAVKISKGKITEEYNQLVNPEMEISEEITKLTGITNDMVKDKPLISQALSDFLAFAKDATLVAHNADFDMGFIKKFMIENGYEPIQTYMDTLPLARALEPDLKNHKLATLTKHYNIILVNHHRASDDARATGEVLLKLIEELNNRGINFDYKLNRMDTAWPKAKNQSYNATIYARNLAGLKNLYELVSLSNLKYFHISGGIPKSELEKRREGLIIGSGNQEGEYVNAILSFQSEEKIKEILDRYDYVEVQTPKYYDSCKERERSLNIGDSKEFIKNLVDIAKKNNKPVVAESYCKYFDKEDYIFRNIILEGQPRKIKGETNPSLYFRTTDEMLEEFNFLDEDLAKEIIIYNPKKIADMIEDFKPIPDGTFPPVIEGSDEELREMTYKKARSIYGDDLPEIVSQRLERELSSIISNGYAVLYIIAQKLVKKSNEDGYLVGSRGSVGSSFVATMADITEVNPLKPHYVCPNCKHSEFIDDPEIGSGVDLPDKVCPVCNTMMKKDGHNIPFEVFLGFEGDKEPDIDLNFAGEYQPTVHKYTEELFGKGKVFRAGTIGTISDKTAYGYIKKYYEDKEENINNSQIKYLQKGIIGTKRTSGQHPGGVMIVPRDKDIEDFCPVQHPADDPNSDIITTHFNYKSISGRILKLDLLGHDVPTIIKMLSDMTGLDPLNIPLDDEETMSIFSGLDALKLEEEIEGIEVGTLGIPEFGTNFVRGMLKDTLPKTFSELVRISGLSHGTDVWLNNAQDLIQDGFIELKDAICTRDDIMIYLINKGLDNKRSFKIMETVRKNRPLDDETIAYMKENGVDDWYIQSCKTIQYLFPKAHAVAYVMMSFRIAYFKVHYPEAFYATYFTIKIQDYPGDIIVNGLDAIRKEMASIKDKVKGTNKKLSVKDANRYSVLEVAEEMYCRGIKQSRVSLKKSDKLRFKVLEKGYIQPPFNALEGVSDSNSISIYEEINKGDFISKQDFLKRTNINKTALEILKNHGVLDELQNENQMSLFDF